MHTKSGTRKNRIMQKDMMSVPNCHQITITAKYDSRLSIYWSNTVQTGHLLIENSTNAANNSLALFTAKPQQVVRFSEHSGSAQLFRGCQHQRRCSYGALCSAKWDGEALWSSYRRGGRLFFPQRTSGSGRFNHHEPENHLARIEWAEYCNWNTSVMP